jgi:hypothetical protein
VRPVPAGRAALGTAGFAGYGYCASHSRFFWGLRLYLVCTPAGMPILWALADPKIGEREILAAMLEVDADLVAARPGLLLITDKGFASKSFERSLSARGITLLRPARKKEILRAGAPMLKKVRQLIESVNDTLKGQRNRTRHTIVTPRARPTHSTTRPGHPVAVVPPIRGAGQKPGDKPADRWGTQRARKQK